MLIIIIINVCQNVDCQNCCYHHQSLLLHQCDQGSLITDMLVSCDTWCSGPLLWSMPWMLASEASIPASGSPPGRIVTSVSSSCASYYRKKFSFQMAFRKFYIYNTLIAHTTPAHFNREDLYCSLKCYLSTIRPLQVIPVSTQLQVMSLYLALYI